MPTPDDPGPLHRPAAPRRSPFGLAIVAGLTIVGVAACRPAAAPSPPEVAGEGPSTSAAAPSAAVDRSRPGPPIDAITEEPIVRVRVVAGASTIVVAAAAPATEVEIVGADDARLVARGPLTITADGDDALLLRDRRGRTTRIVAPAEARAGGDADLAIGDRSYPGRLRIHRRGEAIDVVNHLGLEAYLPGVLERELYPSWEPAAYRAQAIAARSYALWERAHAGDRPHDLEATTASQAYGGRARRSVAIEAVTATRGAVLVHDGRVVPAFYSSAHGRAAQDGVVAFPGVAPDIEPLRGGDRGPWEEASPHGAWGPLRDDRAALTARLALWGRAHEHPIAALRSLAAITVSRRSGAGRPAEFTIIDADGRAFTLPPESFRHACNVDGPGLPRSPRLKSSDVAVAIEGEGASASVVFQGGSGFGHGVGLSQWGAHGQAAAGRDHGEILTTYYPGAAIVTAYP